MNIGKEQVQRKKVVGNLDGKPVFELTLVGGLHLISLIKNGRLETLGAGSHRAVARFIAKQHEPKLAWTELSKSDYVPPECFQDLLPQYEVLVVQLNARNR